MHTDKHILETWERLQARLFHLGWLGEELPTFVATPGGTWLFAEIAREAATIARIAATFLTEAEKAALTTGRTTVGQSADTTSDAGAVSGLDSRTQSGGGEAL
jgi:hypothetical protein